MIWQHHLILSSYLDALRRAGSQVIVSEGGGIVYSGPPRVVLTSGGFDVCHVGHLRLFQASRKLGETLVVVVNGDDFLKRKKGRVVMPLAERMEIVAGFACVDHVVAWNGDTQFVDGAIYALKPDILTKGGDRTAATMAQCELDACQDVGCEVVYGVGGEKVQSSSWLTEKLNK